MRLDSLVNLISALDPATFREVARLCLKARGYRPALSDGPNDGGVDFLLYLIGNAPAPRVVQISVEKKWRPKLKEDAAKIAQHKYDSMLFVSSRRLPGVDFNRAADEALRIFGVTVQKMDAQDIAGLALDQGIVPKILEAIGVPSVSHEPRGFRRPDLRRDVAYACAFFGSDARDLRRAALEESLLTALAAAGGQAERETIVDRAVLSLGLAPNQRTLVISTLDRLRQEGRVRGKNGNIGLDEQALANRRAVQALEQANVAELRREIDACLEPYLKTKARREAATETLFEGLGALLIGSSSKISESLTPAARVNTPEDVSERLRRLEADLETFGLDTEQRRQVLAELARRASESDFGKHIVAGELVIRLLRLTTTHLLQAIEGRDDLTVAFDTPVAMPLLCNLLYEPTGQEYFVASQHAYDQLLAHGVEMVLPRQYVEEIASHLLDAYRDYRDIIDEDPDLSASRNAFVAHYVALHEKAPNATRSFPDYLRAFGLNEELARADFFTARDALMRRLEALFVRYHVQCRDIRPRDARLLKRAQEAIAYIQRASQDLVGRPALLLEHDAVTLGWLYSLEADAHKAYVLCTWDRLHFELRQANVGWDVLDPVALGDLLSLAAPEGHELRIASPWAHALRFSAAAAEKGAAVWEFLVRNERGHLHDADLREQARGFKNAWLAEGSNDPRALDLQTAWERWKREHVSSRPPN